MSVLRGVYVSKLRVRERVMKKERERMSEFYNSLAEKMQRGSCVVMTVLEGESAGKKLLVTSRWSNMRDMQCFVSVQVLSPGW